MQIARTNLATLCRQFGAKLVLPAGIDGSQLLWALAGNESAFGANLSPRHETAYCRGGKYYDAVKTGFWGCLAHCSFGPWQIMYANMNPGISPLELLTRPELTLTGVLTLIQSRILQREGAQTLEQIADAYNSGDWRDKIMPQKYIDDLVANYKVPIGAMA